MRGTLTALVVMVWLAGCAPSTDPSLIAPGISSDLAALRIQQLSKVHYDLRLDIPLDNDQPIEGLLSLGFSFDPSLNQPLIIDFNVPEGAVASLSVDGELASYEHRQEHLIVDSDALADGYHTVDITFTAGEVGLNRNDGYLYTLFVPDRASTVFPCFDQPDLKASYTLTLELPAGWTAVSNGPLSDITEQDGRQVFAFDQSDKISTYLFSFAAGEFQTITDVSGKYPMTLYHRETDTAKVRRNVKDIFEIHHHALAWLEDYTGINYPFKKFDFVLIPSFQYGGMEHVGAIQYKASSLFLEESATPNELLGRASLIAHETAHMWFGDLVTMRWFDDVWMKEVFANFMAAKIVNPLFPEINHQQRFLLAHFPRAYEVDRTAGTHPIRQPLDNLKQAGSLYGAIIYQKAPIVMHKLEQLIGENSFRIGMQEYLKSYAYRAADWSDLIRILDGKTAVNLVKWSEIWVESGGMPTINSTFYEGVDSYFLRFEQKDPTGAGRIWPQRFDISMIADDGTLTRSVQFNDQAVVEIPHSKDTKLPLSVQAGINGTLYGVLDFAEQADMSSYPYGYTMQNINLVEDDLARAAFYIQMHEFLLYKREMPPAYPVLIERYLAEEQNQLNVELLLTYLQELYWQWMLPGQRDGYIETYEALLNQLIRQAEDPRLRSTLFKTLITIASTENQVTELLTIWRDQNPPEGIQLSERDYATLAFELALRLPDESADILATQAERISNSDQRARFDFIAQALAPDEASRDEFFASLSDAKNRAMEPWVGTALQYLHHPVRAEASVRYLRPSLDLLEEIQLTGDIFFPKRWLDQSFWGHQGPEAAEIVRAFLADHPSFNPRLRNKVLQSTDMLFRVVDMHEAMKKAPASAAASLSK